jgi:hypothetical protein
LSYHGGTYDGPDPVRTEIAVGPGQAGRLWQITLANFETAVFRLDPKIPPVYCVFPEKWFDPVRSERYRQGPR